MNDLKYNKYLWAMLYTMFVISILLAKHVGFFGISLFAPKMVLTLLVMPLLSSLRTKRPLIAIFAFALLFTSSIFAVLGFNASAQNFAFLSYLSIITAMILLITSTGENNNR